MHFIFHLYFPFDFDQRALQFYFVLVSAISVATLKNELALNKAIKLERMTHTIKSSYANLLW